MSVRLLICDDETLATDRLKRLLSRRDDVQLVGSASNGAEALDAVARLSPDAILLDVEMPGLDGFDVVEALAASMERDQAPLIVFVTAYPQFAASAYETGAIDFLTKPVRFPRLCVTIDRVVHEIEARSAAGRLEELNGQLERLRRERLEGSREEERIWVPQGGEIVGVAIATLDRISAEREYIRLYRGRDQFLYRCSISSLMPRLEPQRFVRIHRSHVVNLDYIQSIRRRATGGYRVVTAPGDTLPVGRTYHSALRRVIGS